MAAGAPDLVVHGRARWIFTGRAGGCSPAPWDSLNVADHVGDDPDRVRRNRHSAAELVGGSGARLAVVSAVHGADVAVVDRPGDVPGVDALVTTTPGLALMALAADCIPIVLCDQEAGVLAVVHSGWRGVVAAVAPAAVAEMERQGARRGRIRARLGPSICAACFEVGPPVAQLLSAAVPGTGAQTSWGTASVDLPRGVFGQLAQAGVHDVQRDPRCTFHDEGLFSHRRHGVTGRQAVVAMLAP